MKRGAALGLVGAVFVLGLAAGALGGRLLGAHAPGHPGFDGPPPFQRYFMHGDLDLTGEQQDRLEEIFRRQRAKFEDLHRDLEPRVEALMEETHSQLEELLSAEQLERFRAHSHYRHLRSRGPGFRGRRHSEGRRTPETEPAAPPDVD